MYFFLIFLFLTHCASMHSAMRQQKTPVKRPNAKSSNSKKQNQGNKKTTNKKRIEPKRNKVTKPSYHKESASNTQQEILNIQKKLKYEWYVQGVIQSLKTLPPQEIPYKLRIAAENLDVNFVKILMTHEKASPYFFNAMGRYTALDALDDREYETCLQIYQNELSKYISDNNTNIHNKHAHQDTLDKVEQDYYSTMSTILKIRDLIMAQPKLDVPRSSLYKKQLNYFSSLILEDAQKGKITPTDLASYFLKAVIALDKHLTLELMKYPSAQLARHTALLEMNSIIKSTQNDLQKLKEPTSEEQKEKYLNRFSTLQETLKKAYALRLAITYWDFKAPST